VNGSHREGERLKNQVAELTIEIVRLWRNLADLASEPGVQDALTAGFAKANERAGWIADEMSRRATFVPQRKKT
jgi:hypothetical protein